MRALLAVLFIAASAARAQDLTGFERVLLPVFGGPVTGVNGSHFSVSLQFWAESPFRYYLGDFSTFSPDSGAPGSIFLLPTAPPTSGRLMFVEPPATDRIFFSYSLTSADTVALPVVRETAFLTGKSSILGVPIDPINVQCPAGGLCTIGPEYRHALRIYDVDGRGGLEADVRVLVFLGSAGGLWVFQTAHVALDRRDGDGPTYPFYAKLTIDVPCIRFNNVSCSGTGATERVEITPSDAHARYWAFVSSTSNLTQRVRIETPQ